MKAAVQTLKKEKIERVVVATPVAPLQTAREFKRMADEFICLETPPDFSAVGSYYRDFAQVSNEQVVEMLRASAEEGTVLEEQ